MAGHPIPYNAFPDVNPTGAPANDFENIHATPEEFGGLIAHSEETLGHGVEQVGDTGVQIATQRQTDLNDIHATELNSWFADQVTDRWSKFAQLKGRAALDDLPQFKADVDKLRQDAMGKAPSLQEQTRLSSSLRGLQDQYYKFGTNHADSEANTYATKTATDAAANYGNLAAISYGQGDWANFEKNLNNQDMEVRNYLDHQGYDHTTIETEVTKRRSTTLKDVIETQAASDPNAASLLFQRYATQMDAGTIKEVTNKLAPVLRQQGFDIAGSAILGRVPPQDAFVHGERSAGVPNGYTARTISIESNWGQTPDRPGSQYKGLAQGNDAWNKRYGVTDPYDPTQVSNALLSEAQDNRALLTGALGRPPTAGEYYLAHQQGGAGAAALLENPNKPAWQAIRKFYSSDSVAQQAIWGNMSPSMKAQFPDGPTSVPAGAFAQLWSGRYERAGVEVPIIDKAEAYKRADAAYGNNPVMWRGVKSVIDREYNFQEVAQSQRRGELEAQVPGLIADVRAGDVSKPLPPDIALLGPVASSRIQAEWDSANREGQARRSMVFASPQEISDIRSSLESGPGDDEFRHRDMASFDKAVQERDKLIFGNPAAEEEGKKRGDPGAYASMYPTIGAMKAAAKKNPNDPAAFGQYATASLSLQDHLGVPASDQHILSKYESEQFVKQIITPGANSKAMLDGIQKITGDHYQQVYHDLVTQGKLGPSYQLVGALDDANAGVLSRWLQGTAPNEKGEAKTADEVLGESAGHPIASVIRTNVRSNPQLIDLQHSWADSGFSPDQIKGLSSAVEDLAYGKKLYENKDAGAAATEAVEAITGKYTLWSGEGSARVPIENNATVRANAAKVLGDIKEGDLAIPEVIGANRQLGAARAGDYVRLLQASPYWVTSSDGRGIMLKDSYLTGSLGRLVTNKQGQPIYVPFDAPLAEGETGMPKGEQIGTLGGTVNPSP
jgi:hypothetical protein